jgi:hypothetical protein
MRKWNRLLLILTCSDPRGVYYPGEPRLLLWASHSPASPRPLIWRDWDYSWWLQAGKNNPFKKKKRKEKEKKDWDERQPLILWFGKFGGLELSPGSRGQRGEGSGSGLEWRRVPTTPGTFVICPMRARAGLWERRCSRFGSAWAERTRDPHRTFLGSPMGAVARTTVTSGPRPRDCQRRPPAARASARLWAQRASLGQPAGGRRAHSPAPHRGRESEAKDRSNAEVFTKQCPFILRRQAG